MRATTTEPEKPRREIFRAAVVIPIFAAPPHQVIFVARAEHLRNHPGQIAFPGGRADPEDAGDLSRTGLRELEEEVGIGSDRIRLIAELPHVAPISGRFEIAPFVGIVQTGTRLVIDPSETAAFFEVPLAAIVAPDAVHRGLEIVGDMRHETWQFDYGPMHVWGATGRILKFFVEAWNVDDSALRAALAG